MACVAQIRLNCCENASLDVLPGAEKKKKLGEKMGRRNMAVELTASVTSRRLSFHFGNQRSVRRITEIAAYASPAELCLVEWKSGSIPFGRHNYYLSG